LLATQQSDRNSWSKMTARREIGRPILIMWRLCADAGQKQDAGGRMSSCHKKRLPDPMLRIASGRPACLPPLERQQRQQ
jgi:hypothetical protein